MTSIAILILLDRLETGWSPKADEIDVDVRQVDALNWTWAFDGHAIECQTGDRRSQWHGDILYVDQYLGYALTTEVFLWLYDDDESEKVRYLEG